MARKKRTDSSQLTLWACDDEQAVQPPRRPAEQSASSAPNGGPLHSVPSGGLWEQAFSPDNLARALRRVEQNGGAPGPDGMSVGELRAHLDARWPEIQRQLDSGRYRPQPVRRVAIPKSGGGLRVLGVPSVIDRLIQQALLQVLSPLFDPGFAEASFGFRPGRSAHMAVEAARGYVQQGRRFVVGLDLDSFFDRVNHDALMARVARRVEDKRVLRLVRAYLAAGVMVAGATVEREEGTPQGSPLSPLLANVMLDDLDHELERRGHCFVRYADDVRIYVRSERAGQRVLAAISAFIERRLKLRVNPKKSGVSPANQAGFLGFGFYWRKGSEAIKVTVDHVAIAAVKVRIRRLTDRHWGVSMDDRIDAINAFVAGWCAYFAFSDSSHPFKGLDEWMRRRLRQVRWREWKRVRTKLRCLRKLGVPYGKALGWANSRLGSWQIAAAPILQVALPNAYWTGLGLRGFSDGYKRVREAWRTA
jgi:group II intron reverse transcriptase/maturase